MGHKKVVCMCVEVVVGRCEVDQSSPELCEKDRVVCVVVVAEIGRCLQLNSLYLQHNDLTSIPESIGNLRILTRLGLR